MRASADLHRTESSSVVEINLKFEKVTENLSRKLTLSLAEHAH
jgi:hypothetical protein